MFAVKGDGRIGSVLLTYLEAVCPTPFTTPNQNALECICKPGSRRSSQSKQKSHAARAVKVGLRFRVSDS